MLHAGPAGVDEFSQAAARKGDGNGVRGKEGENMKELIGMGLIVVGLSLALGLVATAQLKPLFGAFKKYGGSPSIKESTGPVMGAEQGSL